MIGIRPRETNYVIAPDGRRFAACTGHRYCAHVPTHVVLHKNGAVDCRWPVCDRHANAFTFRHLGVSLKFEPCEHVPLSNRK